MKYAYGILAIGWAIYMTLLLVAVLAGIDVSNPFRLIAEAL